MNGYWRIRDKNRSGEKDAMKTLVVYYSRTGTTKKAAEALAAELKCDVEEIFDIRDRKGPIGFLMAGRDAGAKNLTELRKTKSDLSQYGLVVVGTPIWAWNLSTPIRTYLTQNRASLKKVAFFCTQGSDGSEIAFREMASLCGTGPLATLALCSGDVWKGDFLGKIREFAKKLES
jgi:flavodoxin